MTPQHTPLGELLLHAGVLGPDEIRETLELQDHLGGRFGTNVLELGHAREDEILRALKRQHRIETVRSSVLRSIDIDTLDVLPSRIARRYGIVPFRTDGTHLALATTQPIAVALRDEIQDVTGLDPEILIGLEVFVAEALDDFFGIDPPARLRRALAQLEGRTDVMETPPVREHKAPRAPIWPAPPPLAPAEGPSYREIPAREAKRRVTPTADPATLGDIQIEESPDPRVEVSAGESRCEALERAATALESPSVRDDVAEALLSLCDCGFESCDLFFRRATELLPWDSRPQGDRASGATPIADSRIATDLNEGAAYWLGAPAEQRPLDALLGASSGADTKGSGEVVVLPLRVRGRLAALAVLGGGAQGISEDELARLQMIAARAGHGLEQLIQRARSGDR